MIAVTESAKAVCAVLAKAPFGLLGSRSKARFTLATYMSASGRSSGRSERSSRSMRVAVFLWCFLTPKLKHNRSRRRRWSFRRMICFPGCNENEAIRQGRDASFFPLAPQPCIGSMRPYPGVQREMEHGVKRARRDEQSYRQRLYTPRQVSVVSKPLRGAAPTRIAATRVGVAIPPYIGEAGGPANSQGRQDRLAEARWSTERSRRNLVEFALQPIAGAVRRPMSAIPSALLPRDATELDAVC